MAEIDLPPPSPTPRRVPVWQSFDADSDGGLTREEETAFYAALNAWYDEAVEEREWSELNALHGASLDTYCAAKREHELMQRPSYQRVLVRAGEALAKRGKVIALIIGGFLFAVACGIVLSLFFGGPGCLTPWTSC